MGKTFEEHEQYFVIVDDAISDVVPIDCPVCKSLMGKSDDLTSYQKFSCCHFCRMKWADRRQGEWNNGWRPSNQEIIDENKRRSILPYYRSILTS